MPIIMNFIERLFLLRLNMGPGPMMDLFGFATFKSVSAAIKLGVFEALRGGPITAAEVARQIKADESATTLLLEFLEALGYVEKKKNRYINTKMTVKWVLQNSQNSVANLFAYWEQVGGMWDYLGESIQLGRPAITISEWLENKPGGWQCYQEGMMALSRAIIDQVTAKVKLQPTARRMLDIGGGHGLYSIKLCHKYPELSATIIDLPHVLQTARKTIATEKMSDRITFQEGDFWINNLGSGYDVVLLFNIVHGYSPERNIELFRKIVGALNSEGQIFIMDQIVGTAASPLIKTVVGLMGLSQFNSTGGKTYSFNEIDSWLRTSGFTVANHYSLNKSPGIGIVVGTKQSIK